MTVGDGIIIGLLVPILTVLVYLYSAVIRAKDAQIELLKEKIPGAQELAAAAAIWKEAADAERGKHGQATKEWERERNQLQEQVAALKGRAIEVEEVGGLLDGAFAILGGAVEMQARNMRFFEEYIELTEGPFERAGLTPGTPPAVTAHLASMAESLKDIHAAKNILERVVPLLGRLRLPPGG